MATKTGRAAEVDAEIDDLGAAIGANLRRLRTGHGLTLDALSRLSGVSRAMIGQIEAGRSMPTIGVLWKLSRALGEPFEVLMEGGTPVDMTVLRVAETKVLSSLDGTARTRALFPADRARRTEFYEKVLRPGAVEVVEAHAPGTLANLVITHGLVELTAGAARVLLETADAVHFHPDVRHSYRNLGDKPAVMYLVVTYPVAAG
ncbi:MAG: XRE family transcriptional regulator [Azospirillaceae bacterium]|nr:XRE family transcriptional regulator [Azospirillaceae bacterium]